MEHQYKRLIEMWNSLPTNLQLRFMDEFLDKQDDWVDGGNDDWANGN